MTEIMAPPPTTAPPSTPASVPDYRKLAATLADLGTRAATMGRDRGDAELERLAQRLHGYARAIQRDLGGRDLGVRDLGGRGLRLSGRAGPDAPPSSDGR